MFSQYYVKRLAGKSISEIDLFCVERDVKPELTCSHSVELLSAVDRANLLGQKLLMVISEEKTD